MPRNNAKTERAFDLNALDIWGAYAGLTAIDASDLDEID